MEITELEDQIINALLAGRDPILSTLRQQYAQASVTNREFTGVGFFTHFSIANTVSRVEHPNFVIDDVFLEVTGTENGASALLFIRNGSIDFLEVVTLTGDWPDDPVLTSIHYFRRKPGPGPVKELTPSKERDLEVTRLAWSKNAKDDT